MREGRPFSHNQHNLNMQQQNLKPKQRENNDVKLMASAESILQYFLKHT